MSRASKERAIYKKALEDIAEIADPPGGPRHEDCERILTIAVLGLEYALVEASMRDRRGERDE